MRERGVRGLAVTALLLAVLGVVLGVRLEFFSLLPLVVAAALGSAAFLMLRADGDPPASEATPERPIPRPRVRLVAATAFFAFSALSLVAIAGAQYAKPVLYYVFIAGAAAAVALYAFSIDGLRSVLLAIGMIWIFALNLFGTSQLVFPLGIGGADSSTHIHFLVAPIAANGYIPPVSSCGLIYGDFPIHHIFVASGSILAGMDPARAYYGLGFFAMTVPVLATFVIVRSIFGARAALFGALILAGASYYISWAAHPAPLTYAIPLISVLMVLLVRMVGGTDARVLLLAGIVGLALILTHPYSSVIFGVALLGLLVAQTVVAKTPRLVGRGTTAVGILFAYTLLFDWSNFSCLMDKSLRLAAGWGRAFADEAIVSPPAVYDALPLSTIVLNTLGDAMLLGLAVVGFFVMLRSITSVQRVVILGPTLALLSLAVLGIVTDLVYILPNRIYVYLQVVGLAPLAAVALLHAGRMRSRPTPRSWKLRAGLVVVIAGAFVFASATSTVAGFETSPFAGDRPYVKLYDTNYEASALGWMCDHVEAGRVRVSLSFSSLLRQRMNSCLVPYNSTVQKMTVNASGVLLPGQFQPGTVVVFSHFDFDPGFQSGILGVGKAGFGLYQKLEPSAIRPLEEFNRVYSNGGIDVYVVPP